MSEHFQPHEVDWTAEKVKRLWDFFAGDSSFDKNRFSAHSGPAIIDWVFEQIEPKESTHVDIGCGTGDLILSLLEHPEEVVRRAAGFEFSPDSIERARQRCHHMTRFGGVELIEQGKPTPRGFDIAWMIEVVEHLGDEELDSSLKLAAEALKPGGYLVVTTPNRENIEAKRRMCPDCGAIFHPKQHVRSWSASSLSDRLKEDGFVTTHAIETNWLEHRLPRPVRLAKRVYRQLRPLIADDKMKLPHLGVIARKE